MLLIKIISVLLLAASPPEYDFYLSLDFYESPVFHLERSTKIFRQNRKIFIKHENYSGRDFEKPFDTEDYITLVSTLNRAGIWSVRSDSSGDRIKNSYYFLTVRTPSRMNLIRYETHSEMESGTSPVPLLIRTIENYVHLYNPDNM